MSNLTIWTIRDATTADLAAIAAIYDHQIATGYATFDTAPQGVGPFAAKLAGEDELLVGTQDGRVLGYAYSAPYRTRAAYAATRETSVYLAPEGQGRGLGTALYTELLGRLDRAGMHLVVAGIALPNDASEALHRSFGFERVGVFTEVGRKFDRWIDVAFYQRVAH